MEIVADIGSAMDSILKELERLQTENRDCKSYPREEAPETFQRIRSEVIQRIEIFKDDDTYPVKPEKVIFDVRKALGTKDIVISDVGTHKLWIAKIYQAFEPNTCIISNGFASMGFALPGALGAKLAFPEKAVVAMTGDGGFLMNVQELETAVRMGLSIIVVVWVDNDLNLISTKQNHEFGKSVFTKFDNPDFVQIARSFGAQGFHVKSVREFSETMQRAKTVSGVPVVIAVDVDYSRNEILFDDSFHPYVNDLNHKEEQQS